MSRVTFSASPSQAQLSSLLEHYQNRRYEDAEKLAIHITEQFPHHQFSWKVLGAVLKQTGRVSEAVFAGKKQLRLLLKMPKPTTTWVTRSKGLAD